MTHVIEETLVEMGSALTAPVQSAPSAMLQSVTVQSMIQQAGVVQELLKQVLKVDEHYGVIPGTGTKPTLLKPGAEKIAALFQLSSEIKDCIISNLDNGHREYRVTIALISRGRVAGMGTGSCSTMESKYRYRNLKRVCPECGMAAIIKGKAEYGGGWLCFKKQEGCGSKFDIDASDIVDQEVGKTDHTDPADYWNTVLKMAKKRALVDAVLTTTATSDLFTQDIEDMPDLNKGKAKPKAQSGNETVSNSTPPPEKKTSNGGITDKQLKLICVLEKKANLSRQIIEVKLMEDYKVDSHKRLTKAQASELIVWLQSGLDAIKDE